MQTNNLHGTDCDNGIVKGVWQRPGSQACPPLWVLRPVILLFDLLRRYGGIISRRLASGKEISRLKS
jgi:hypothetical protein